jgi:hypothetical protein
MNTANSSLQPRSHLPSEACPSELELDRFHYGELGAAKEEEVTRHIEACAVCAARLRARESGFAAFGEVDPDRIFGKVSARLAAENVTMLARMRRAIASPVIVPLAAAACALFLFLARTPEPETIRSKGRLELSVFRERRGAVEELASGEAAFKAGDRVRFKIRLPEQVERSQILIVGVEASGRMFTYYPSDGTNRSKEPNVRPDGALAGAIELDSYQGDEWLYLVHCSRGFSIDELVRKTPGSLGVPKECELASFLMKRME